VDCVEGWVIDLLELLCAAPIPLAAGAQQIDAPALLRLWVEEWTSDDRERRAGENV